MAPVAPARCTGGAVSVGAEMAERPTRKQRKCSNRVARNAARTAAGKCYQCNLRPPSRGRRCDVCAGRKGTPRPKVPAPEPRRLRLVHDPREGLFSRRWRNCVHLNACEIEWAEVYRGADIQARCPVRCAYRRVVK